MKKMLVIFLILICLTTNSYAIGRDKIFHAGACFVATTFLSQTILKDKPKWVSGTIVFVGMSFLKEVVYDGWMGRGCSDIEDVAANGAGVLVGVSIPW